MCLRDRPGAEGEPLYLDVKSMFYGKKLQPMIVGGRYGLSSKDTTPAQILAVFENLAAEAPKEHFTVGITDDVTNLSLPVGEEISLAKPGTFEALFFGLGADGTVEMCIRDRSTARWTSRTSPGLRTSISPSC